MLTLYTEFRATPAGQDIGIDKFVRFPLRLIYELIRISGERDKRMANIGSRSVARLTGIILSIAQSFGKNKTAIPTIDAFLPFPIEDDNQFMVETREIYKKLISARRLPLYVIAELNKVINPSR